MPAKKLESMALQCTSEIVTKLRKLLFGSGLGPAFSGRSIGRLDFLSVTSLLAFSIGSAAVAAEIVVESGEANARNGFDLVLALEGEISNGDAETLRAIVAEELPDTYHGATGSVTLELDSPGGVFLEGIALMDVLFELSIQTRIRSDAECYSACALAFMAGRQVTEASTFEMSRTVEPGGLLGFHAPSLAVSGSGSIPVSLLNSSYESAINSLGELMARSAALELQPSLLLTIATTPPTDLYILEYVDDFARWDIDVEIDASSWEPDRRDIARMCQNYELWQEGRSVRELENGATQSGFPTRREREELLAAQVAYYDPPGQTGVRSRYAYVTTLEYEWTEVCVVQLVRFNGRWYPSVHTSTSSPEVTIQAIRESNFGANRATILHALPHDFLVERLRP